MVRIFSANSGIARSHFAEMELLLEEIYIVGYFFVGSDRVNSDEIGGLSKIAIRSVAYHNPTEMQRAC